MARAGASRHRPCAQRTCSCDSQCATAKGFRVIKSGTHQLALAMMEEGERVEVHVFCPVRLSHSHIYGFTVALLKCDSSTHY